jgi:phosphotriesterase-related protein
MNAVYSQVTTTGSERGTVVRTVLGDIDPKELGRCDYHEHLFQSSPMLAGEELDDAARSAEEAASLGGSGFDAMIEATPIGLGRQPDSVARISALTGLKIVHTTGAHHDGHYPRRHPLLSCDTEALAAWFTSEVMDGIRSEGPPHGFSSQLASPSRRPAVARTPQGSAVKAGLVKVGITYWEIGAFERRVLDAAAETCIATGVGIMIHLEHGSAAHEVLDAIADHGVSADHVILAHVDRNLDAGLHRELAARGAYLGYDGMARHARGPDSAILDCAEAVICAGKGDRLLLGGDVARRSRYLAYGGMPGLRYLGERFVPRLRERIGAAALERILRDNPRRVLAFEPRELPLAGAPEGGSVH